MKKNVRIANWPNNPYWERYKGSYELSWVYFRTPRTFNEIKQNHHALDDGYKVRGKRRKIPTSWDDIWPSQLFGRDWKRFTKKKKQWQK